SAKYPESAFREIPALIGRRLSHPVIQEYRRRYPYHKISSVDATGQLVFHLNIVYDFKRRLLLGYSKNLIRTLDLTIAACQGRAITVALCASFQEHDVVSYVHQ
ncbi:unnamed protein product, partial [Protopolystoma xenopodis]